MKKNFNKQIYIVDGPDCTGKTTLCKKLSEIHNIPYYHLTYYKDKDQHINQFKTIYNLIKNSNDGFIVDRYILSELVYADVYRNSEYFDSEWLVRILNDFLTNKNIIRIIALPSNKQQYIDFFNKNLKDENRKEMYDDKQSEVYDTYLNYVTLYDNKHEDIEFEMYDVFDQLDRKNIEINL